MRGPRRKSEDDMGERIAYNPDFNGPLKGRSCTDVICLLLFLVFIGCWIGIGIFAFARGDPEKLLVPRDSEGSRCGYDAHVIDKPYLHFFDLTKCLEATVPFAGCNTPQVCVKECPKDFYIHRPGINDIDLICKYETTPGLSSDQLVEKGECAKWVLPSTPLLKRCLYKTEDRRAMKIPARTSFVDGDEISEVKKFLEMAKSWIALFVQYTIEHFSDSVEAQQVGYKIVDDVVSSYKEIILGVALSIIVCIIYIVLLRWIAPVMVWLSILGALAGLSFCVYYSFKNYQFYKDNPYEFEQATNAFDREFKKSSTWLWILIIFAVILGLLFLIIVFLRKRIVLAIALIQEGSKAVGSTTAALFFPIAPWILQFGVICYAIAVAIYISTVGNPLYEVRNFKESECNCPYVNGDECDVKTFSCGNKANQICHAACKFIQTSNDKYVPYIHAFNIFGFFWGVFFVSALCEMILAGVFATWYWTFDKSKVPFWNVTTSTLRTLRYHIGTVAFGSLIITICRIIRVILEYIDHKLKKYDNAVTKAILCCLKCFFWCLEKFLKFINRNAYIMCAIHGKNFCISAKDAFNLLFRNILRVFVLDKITDFLFFLSKIIVVIGVSSIIYSILAYVSTTKLNYIYIPIIFVAICTYLVASVFFKVYTMAIDTLFLCFLEDCERNDGSRERPYFMSRSLMGVLNKKNK